MKLLDLYCGAGGCAMGYHRAGFAQIVGIDIAPQRRYPFTFVRMDAIEALTRFSLGGVGATIIDDQGRHWSLEDFDAIHASPPCKPFSAAKRRNKHESKHPDLLTPTRELLQDLAVPWVIENVTGAPMRPPAIQLCGLMFGLKVFRHRWFESSQMLFAPSHPPHRGKRIGVDGFCSVHGHGDYSPGNWRSLERKYQHKEAWAVAMGIDWMTRDELSQAIPPAYTEYVGRQMIAVMREVA